ncbi:tRNA lysidine(34) synthetase TilS [Paenibacillus thermotolerans]|uniref:tRNA lysidine(34) synthetase TilS n=1 Tax=Paenibacillus thermotolerans TaxID=3027807 RepID=UPI00236813D1|nr:MULTISPECIES: tRNA lysidine(34) synthetase TilS [unclassified Paenibacillus]
MSETDVLRITEETIREKKLFEEGERIVVAVSGGADSVALLHLLHRLSERWGWSLTVVHINHGLRGEESDEEERFVGELSDRLGLPFRSVRVPVKEALKDHGNLQAVARELRYEALRQAASAAGTATVALGHHADDQAETVLMRILRGTGPEGLSGIRFVRHAYHMKLVRPLLRITKTDLAEYCEKRRIPFRTDSSNASRKYFRNVVRLDILPYLMKHREGVKESLTRLAQISADENDFLDAQAGKLVSELTVRTEHGFEGDRGTIVQLHVALQRRMFKIILSCLKADDSSIDFSKLERMREAVNADAPTNMELRLTDTIYFRRTYDRVEWTTRLPAEPQPYEYAIHTGAPGTLYISEAKSLLEWTIQDTSVKDNMDYNDPYAALFDADEAGEQLTIRCRRPGDKLEPYGLKGSKKVKDMFIDCKVPPERRESWPLVFAGDGTLLWVPGIRRSRHALADDGTRRVLVVRLRMERGTERNFFAEG